MRNKFFNMCAVLLMAVAALCGCEKNANDARAAFIGDYSFVSEGSIDFYLESKKVTLPMINKGEMTIAPAQKENAVWVIADNDSTLAYISGNAMFMEPVKETTTMSGMKMDMSFTYGKATLEGDKLSLTAEMEVTATYQSATFTGNGQVDIVATKK